MVELSQMELLVVHQQHNSPQHLQGTELEREAWPGIIVCIHTKLFSPLMIRF